MSGLWILVVTVVLRIGIVQSATYHPGYPAAHVTRLHRYDHSGIGAMLEAEAKWSQSLKNVTEKNIFHMVGGGLAHTKAKRFVQLSESQTEALHKHHQSMLVQVGGTMHGQAKHMNQGRTATSGITLREVRRYYHESKWEANGDVLAERLSSLDSQYVGPIGVGTTVTPPGCKQVKTNSFLQPGRDSSISSPAHNGESCQVNIESQVWVVFDTGSTNIWVNSDLCKAGSCIKPGRRRYDHLLSQTYQPPEHDVSLTIQFGTGKISGQQGIDDFHVGPFTVENQTFGLIQQQEGKVFDDIPFEGILGLAFPKMSANRVVPFFDNVIKQKALPKNEFAFYFSLDTPAANAVFWGGVDKTFHSGPIEYFSVTDPYYWSIPLLSFRIGNEELIGRRDKGRDALLEVEKEASAWDGPNAIVDTGTTFFTAEGTLFDEIMRRLPMAPCNDLTDVSHPPITYRLRNSAGEPRDFVLRNMQYMSSFGGSCSPAFMKINIPRDHGPAMVLGEVFLRHYFSVFDRGNGGDTNARIGFAPASHGDDAVRRLKHLTRNQPAFSADSPKI